MKTREYIGLMIVILLTWTMAIIFGNHRDARADTSWLNPVVGKLFYKDVPATLPGTSGYVAPVNVVTEAQKSIMYNESAGLTTDLYFIAIEPDEHKCADGVTAEYAVIRQLDMLWSITTNGGAGVMRFGVIEAIDGASADICWGLVTFIGGATVGRDYVSFGSPGESFELDGSTAVWVDCRTKSLNNTHFQTDTNAVTIDPVAGVTKPAKGDIVGYYEELLDGATFNTYYNLEVGYGH